MEAKHIVPPDSQLPTASHCVCADVCQQAKEAEMGATLFTENNEGRNFDFDFTRYFPFARICVQNVAN